MKSLLTLAAVLFFAGHAHAQTQFNKNQDPAATLQNAFDNASDAISTADVNGKTCVMYRGKIFIQLSISAITITPEVNRGPYFPESTKNVPWPSTHTWYSQFFDTVTYTETNSELFLKLAYNNNEHKFALNLRKSGKELVFKLDAQDGLAYGYCWKN